ncbi:MAG TPA: hypothetical protein VEL68_21585 [Thermodesulfobacteriota bacterium]|nr:hypothetical protein [Thermodesulfobacteriota bacterium]
MGSGPNIVRNVLLTFAIGFFAAISPFLFMQLLPALLNPSLHPDPPNYLAIILTGVLIGAITSILFANQFEKKGPQDIFFYALGIPAILIATVSNLSTEYKAVGQVSEVRESLISAVLSPPKPEVLQEMPKPVPPPQTIKQGWDSRGNAWAQERQEGRPLLLTQALNYFVVIGEYDNEKAAWDDYKKWKEKRLRTELYFPKDLGVFEIRKGQYILVYSRHSSPEEANKVFQLLRINDPGLNVKILKY